MRAPKPVWRWSKRVRCGYLDLATHKRGVDIARTVPAFPGILVDLDAQGKVIGIEVML